MSAEVVTCSKTIALHSLESRQPLNSYTYHRGIVNSVTVNHTSPPLTIQTKPSPAADRTENSS